MFLVILISRSQELKTDPVTCVPQTITSSPIVHSDDETETMSDKESVSKSSIYKVPDAVHADFRLFISTRTDLGLALPAVLIQRGLNLACEAKNNLRETVETNFRVAAGSLVSWAPVWGEAAKTAVFKVSMQTHLGIWESCEMAGMRLVLAKNFPPL